jgi:hypothetical protein
MKILIEMPSAIYDGFIDKLERLSREYAVLKNGLIVRHSEASDNERWTLHASAKRRYGFLIGPLVCIPMLLLP